MPQDFDSLVARLRTHLYASMDELQRDVSAALSALADQPSLLRGLKKDIVADVQGGTTLGVGDPFAGLPSDYLVQNPAGHPTDVGGGLLTRRQTRVEARIRRLPATVTQNATFGQQQIEVSIVAQNPAITTDPVTGVQISGDPMAGLAPASPLGGEPGTVDVTGQPFVHPRNSGVQPVTAGQSIDVTMAETYQADTTWTSKNGGRTWTPNVVRTNKETVPSIVNDFQYGHHVCTPGLIATSPIFPIITPAGNFNWDLTSYQNTGRATPGSYWRIVQNDGIHEPFPTFGAPWWAAGTVDGTGKLVNLPDTFWCDSAILQFVLEQGCSDGTTITWINLDSPGFNTSPVYSDFSCLSYYVTRKGFAFDPAGHTWDLTPWQGNWRGYPGSKWRVLITGYITNPVTDAYPWYAAGTVDASGFLAGLPNNISFPHSDVPLGNLTGIIETGCDNGTTITWTRRLTNTPPFSRTSPHF